VAQLGARLDGIEEVVGSNPIGSTKRTRSNPNTWVTERTAYIGNSLRREVVVDRFARSEDTAPRIINAVFDAVCTNHLSLCAFTP
jgi:hypothetical protein